MLVVLSSSKDDFAGRVLPTPGFDVKDPAMRQYYVYMLTCADGSYYVGITNCVERRVDEHQGGYVAEHYTFSRRPVQLVYQQGFTNVNDAIGWEKRVKGWTRAKKQALIVGGWAAIQRLARGKAHR